MYSARLLELTWKRSLGHYKIFNFVKLGKKSVKGVKLGYKKKVYLCSFGQWKISYLSKCGLKMTIFASYLEFTDKRSFG